MSGYDGNQLEYINDAVLDMFTRDELSRFLRFHFDLHLDNIAPPTNFMGVVFVVVEYFNRRGMLDEFILKIHQHRPNNPDFLLLSQQRGIAPDGVPDFKNAELIIDKTNSFLDPMGFITKLGQIIHCICQIRTHEEKGTGFLINPDIVLTNYHVMKGEIDGESSPENVEIIFDYLSLPDGRLIDKGFSVGLHSDWLIDHSLFSKYDTMASPPEAPKVDELDYAVIRLEKEVGNYPVGSNPFAEASPRGWIKFPQKRQKFKPGTPLFIVQHPGGQEMKLAMDDDGVLEVNGNETRVRYKTNTKPGSSGAPCFNQDWELVAIHHSGDPKKRIFSSPEYNQGIPIHAIDKLLQKRKKAEVLSYE